MAKLLKSTEVTANIAANIEPRVAALQAKGVQPTLAFVRVGERPDDMSYERTATKRAEKLGIATKSYTLPADCSQADLEATLRAINADASVHGCLMFRPLPESIDEKAMCDVLAAEKDVDGISTASLAAVFTHDEGGFPPCTAQACLEMLDSYGIEVAGKHAVVVGRSLVIGRPVAMMLLARNASVTICHSRSENLEDICQTADILIFATGNARAFGAPYFHKGQVVLDVGINFDETGTLCGDVDFEAAEAVVDAITPVPGGIGSVTTSVTMLHTVRAAERQL